MIKIIIFSLNDKVPGAPLCGRQDSDPPSVLLNTPQDRHVQTRTGENVKMTTWHLCCDERNTEPKTFPRHIGRGRCEMFIFADVDGLFEV